VISGGPRSQGKIDVLALDIPLQATEKTRFLSSWTRFGLETVEAAAGAEHFSGTLAGSVENGALTPP
jgi:uncharacterized protein YhdP